MASVTSALPTPWRYQGRMLESAAGTPDLYDFQARSYNPALGTFTSLDSKLGSAQNTALLNGYLYANANPATLVDPDGHRTHRDDDRGTVVDRGMYPAREAATSRSCTYPGGGSEQYCVTGSTTTTTWGMDTSTTSTTTEGDTTTTAVSNTSGGQTTTKTSTFKTGVATETTVVQPRDCGFANLGCFDPGQAVSNVTGTANQAWNTVTHNGDPLCIATIAVPGACGLIHAAEENPEAAALWGGAAAACAVGLLTRLPAKYLCAPLGGILGYTAGNAAVNVAKGRDPTTGWNVADAGVAGAAGLLLVGLSDVGVGTALVLGAAAGGAADAFSQWKDHPDRPIDWHHVECAARAGAVGNVPLFSKDVKSLVWNLIQTSLGALGCKDY